MINILEHIPHIKSPKFKFKTKDQQDKFKNIFEM